MAIARIIVHSRPDAHYRPGGTFDHTARFRCDRYLVVAVFNFQIGDLPFFGLTNYCGSADETNGIGFEPAEAELRAG